MTKKIVVLGDTHGLNKWEKIVKIEKDADKIIFIGDYFDSFDIQPVDQIENFKRIYDYKLNNPSKVELLIGNHDFHYMTGIEDEYSGYNHIFASQYRGLINKALDENFLKMCHREDNYLFSHAGVSKTWCDDNDIMVNDDIADEINELFRYQPKRFAFTVGKSFSPYGDDINQTPIWIRPKSLELDAIDGFMQIVGHTQIVSIEYHMRQFRKSIDVDALPYNEYLVIENNITKIKELKYVK